MKILTIVFLATLTSFGAQAETTGNAGGDDAEASAMVSSGVYSMSRRCSNGDKPNDSGVDDSDFTFLNVMQNKFAITAEYTDGETGENCVGQIQGVFERDSNGLVARQTGIETRLIDGGRRLQKSPRLCPDVVTPPTTWVVINIAEDSFQTIRHGFGKNGSCQPGDNLITTYKKI